MAAPARRVTADMAFADADAIAALRDELSFERYAASFAAARGGAAREVHLFVGPPNSGKTYEALRLLAAAPSGAYLAPLRLLALEGRDELEKLGVSCDLVTGEDRETAEGATHVSSTVECIDARTPLDTIVVDEAQMLFDEQRGWAWTAALLGAPARALVVLCAPHAEAAVRALLRAAGEEPGDARVFERKGGALAVLDAPVALADLEPGDAVVSFARMDALVTRDTLLKGGRAAAVIYGALPPDVRRREAARFASGAVTLLSATDAIGMGLNLPVRRILFGSLVKWDGFATRDVSVSEVHQIGGRAGRFGHVEEGFVGVLDSAEPGALPALRAALARAPAAPRDFRAAVMLSAWHVDAIAARLGLDDLRTVIDVFARRLGLTAESSPFVVADVERLEELATALDSAARALPLADRFAYATAPVGRDKAALADFIGWAAAHAADGAVGAPAFLLPPPRAPGLADFEKALQAANLWLYLDAKFPAAHV